jgi:hypothetical protein
MASAAAQGGVEIFSKPPRISVTWPKDGTCLAQPYFDLYGRCDNSHARITAFVCNDQCQSAVREGFVEPNGCLWVDGTPMKHGKNYLTLVATDRIGNSSFTNLVFFGSKMVLSMDPLTHPGEVWFGKTTVTGFCSDTNRTVSVNGVRAVMNPDGRWTAVDVPSRSPDRGGADVFELLAEGGDDDEPLSPPWLPAICGPAIDNVPLRAGISRAG